MLAISIISNYSITILNIFEYYFLIPDTRTTTRGESKSPVAGHTQATVLVIRTSTGLHRTSTRYDTTNTTQPAIIIRNKYCSSIIYKQSTQNNDVEEG